jgi:uncharacterized membrane protein YkvI
LHAFGRWQRASRVGFTYIGTVIGAGFASGQEILQFFTSFGEESIWGVLLATGLFAWLGSRMMLMGARLRAFSYEEFNTYLFGERWGRLMTLLVGLMLFGVTTAMMSGTGALFQEQLGFSFHLGVILTALFSFIVILRGMDGILSINTLVVPFMFLFTVLVAIYAWGSHPGSLLITFPEEPLHHHWFLAAIVYVAFNLVMMQAVLVPLGAEIEDESTIRLGAWIGGLGLGVMLLAFNFAMQVHWSEVAHLEIPMAYVISTLGAGMKYLFLVTIWAEIFTTLVGNVYGLTANLRQMIPLSDRPIVALIFVLGYLFSLFGFPALVRYLYPLFGYCGLMLLVLLIFRRLPNL